MPNPSSKERDYIGIRQTSYESEHKEVNFLLLFLQRNQSMTFREEAGSEEF